MYKRECNVGRAEAKGCSVRAMCCPLFSCVSVDGGSYQSVPVPCRSFKSTALFASPLFHLCRPHTVCGVERWSAAAAAAGCGGKTFRKSTVNVVVDLTNVAIVHSLWLLRLHHRGVYFASPNEARHYVKNVRNIL